MKWKGALLIILLLGEVASAVDISGEWEMTIRVLDNVIDSRLTLQSNGERISGRFTARPFGEINLKGLLTNDSFTLNGTQSTGEPFGPINGRLKNEELSGNISWPDIEQASTWSAIRPKKAPESPRVHDFEPKSFYHVFSDAIPAVLHIFPGDKVRTWTVDTAGADKNGVIKTVGSGNPQTGPFFVEGAFPGDTLVVKLNKVRLNRNSAFSGSQIVLKAVTPYYAMRTTYQDDFDGNWFLDRDAGVARLQKPTDALRNYSVRLKPMLGCIAVAPANHEAISTLLPGAFGGNLDYNEIVEGATVYLPVFAKGALLFLGDGHAVQGDGELTHAALETSMDVEFTVDLIRGSSGSLRAENSEYLMALGIGNSLEDALQLSTTRLAKWLQTDYKFSPDETAILLGTAIRYDIAEVASPIVHIVAKIRKDAMPKVK